MSAHLELLFQEVYEDGVPYDLKLKVADDRHSGLSAIENLMIDSDKSKNPLSTVAEVRSSSTFNSIGQKTPDEESLCLQMSRIVIWLELSRQSKIKLMNP